MTKTKLLFLFTMMLPTLSACERATYPEFSKEGNWKVGVLQPVEHSALNQAYQGFKAGLNEKGWEEGKNLSIEFKNAGGNASDQKTMAKSLISECDLVLGIGTGAAQSVKSAQYNAGTKKPILFTAVTDPIDAKLVESNEKPGGLVTGTSDAQPVDAQVDIIFDIKPETDKIGVLYTASEDNSAVQARQAKKVIEEKGAECIIQTATNATDISSAASALASIEGLDAIYIPTDNNVSAHMNLVKEVVSNKGILVCTGEEGMLRAGGQITLSINYFELGKQTGYMAAMILNGDKKPEEIPVLTMSKEDCSYLYSSRNMEDAGVTLSDSFDLTKWADVDAN